MIRYFSRFVLLLVSFSIPISFEVVSAQPTLRGMTTTVQDPTDLDDLASHGANFVRYQLSWTIEADTASKQEYLDWFHSRLDNLDLLVAKCNERGMKMLLTLHTSPGGLVTRTAPAQSRVFEEQWAQDTLIEVWEELAERYVGNNAIWAFEIMNEPAEKRVAPGLLSWKALAPVVIAAIREIDPNRKIVVGPTYGNPDRLSKLGNLNIPNVVYNIHSYFPSNFRNQGLNGRKINVSYPKKRFNRDALAKSVAKGRIFQRKHGVEVMIGEFAAPRWAPNNSAVRYLRDYIRIFERYGWNWTLHAWREADIWSLEHTDNFSNTEVSPTETNRLKLVKKFWDRN